MARTQFEELDVYKLSEQLCDSIYQVVRQWQRLDQNTVGTQVIRAADSIGANIAEGAGRGSFADNRRFIRIARGSLYEVKHFLRRAFRRQLLQQGEIESIRRMLDELAPRLNAYLNSIGRDQRIDRQSNPAVNGPLTTDH
jgi:four helix bundle protein